MAQKKYNKKNVIIGVVGGFITLVILVVGTILSNIGARDDAENAGRSISLLYLSELAERRAAVVSANIENNEEVISTAIDLITDDDLLTVDSLKNYQSRMKDLFKLEKFAFVNEEGQIYTAVPTDNVLSDYAFNDHYLTISEPEVSILSKEDSKKVVIAVKPQKELVLETKKLVVCFMEIDSSVILKNISIDDTNSQSVTFCNVYTTDGMALTDAVLGGLAAEDNLLDAMKNASFEKDYSSDKFLDDFTNANSSGIVSFTYNGIAETLSYSPVKGTNWKITYLVRETAIANRLSNITNRMVIRTFIVSFLITLILIGVFVYIIFQIRKTSKIQLESETLAVESKIKQEELEGRLAMQEQLVEQNKLITALSSDYWSVFYIDLDKNEGICYQTHPEIESNYQLNQQFNYFESIEHYATTNVLERYRDDFIKFLKPEHIKEDLKNKRVISYRYMVHRRGVDSYEMIRVAGVRHPEDRENDSVHAVALCFTNVDEETRASIAQNEMLSSALLAAEQASKAKTTFLSNMSHEIRTPMNAIIGLDNIALNDPTISSKTKDYLEKIGASAEHLLTLINDILDMSRIESGRMVLKNDVFSFSKLLEYVNTMFSAQAQEKGLDYSCSIIGHLDDYYVGDNLKIRQVLINLLGNAIKFTNQGHVSLTIEKTAEFDNKSTLSFTIKDTGIGMSEEFLPHIFESFAQENAHAHNRYGSSGLGLAITKSIIEMMNGNISVTSKKGEGTTFNVALTIDNAPESTNKLSADIKPEEMVVLVVDDDEVAIEHTKLVLQKANIYVEVAYNGKDAIKMVTDRHNKKEPYNLILVDWKMPDMDGVETTREIKKIIGNESAIIILTAYKWDDVLDEALQAGVDSFIAKPLFVSSVVEEFKEAIRRKESLKNKQIHKTSLAGKRILLAEDVEINAEIMKAVLEMRSMEVEVAENGLIALNMFKSHPEGYYSAILMDMMMPEMDGLEATKHIRHSDKKDAKTIPIIALTANAFDEDVQRSLQAGLNAHLSKPVKPEVVFETLENLIKE